MISIHHLLISALLLVASPISVYGQLHERSNNAGLHRNLRTRMPSIVTVIDSTTDLTELCFTFHTLARAKAFPNASIMAFHGLPLSDTDLNMLQSCTTRSVTFIDISTFYQVFPEGFTPIEGVNYDSQQTEHFFISDLWELPHMRAHDVILRVSDSSCLSFDNKDLPDFPSELLGGFSKDQIKYQSRSVPGASTASSLMDETIAYITNNGITPQNSNLWSQVLNSNAEYQGLPRFDTSFEIVRRSFMAREDVQDFHHYVANVHADEFYNNGWSTEVLRFLTMAIFGADDESYITHINGYVNKEDVENGEAHPECRFSSLVEMPIE